MVADVKSLVFKSIYIHIYIYIYIVVMHINPTFWFEIPILLA